MIRRDRRDRRGFVYLSDGKESRRWPAMVIVGDSTEGGHARKLFRRWNQTGPSCPFEGKNMQEWSRHFGSESGEERPKRHRSPGTLGTLPSTWKANPRNFQLMQVTRVSFNPREQGLGLWLWSRSRVFGALGHKKLARTGRDEGRRNILGRELGCRTLSSPHLPSAITTKLDLALLLFYVSSRDVSHQLNESL